MSRPKGFKHTEETKSKMREHHAGFHRPHTKAEKIKISEGVRLRHQTKGHPLKGKHHSKETKLKMSLSRRGEANANWKGGLTAIIRGIRRLPQYYQWRKAVLERDNHICQDCGSQIKIDAHHIKSLWEYPELVFDVNNGLTLCQTCHKRHSLWQKLNGKGKVRCKKHA